MPGREPADQKRSRLSRGELTPFSERGNPVLLEDIAAVEVAILVEVVVDRGVNGGKLLQGLYTTLRGLRLTWGIPKGAKL